MCIEIGVRIQQTLDEQDLSQRELARRLKVSASTLRGWIANPSVLNPQQLKAIADALGINYEWLVSGLSGISPTGLLTPLSTPRLSPSLAQIYMDRGELYFSLGLNEEALAQFVRASSYAADKEELDIQICALSRAARAAVRLSDIDYGISLINSARKLFTIDTDILIVADTLLTLANLNFRKGNFDVVKARLSEALALLDSTDNANPINLMSLKRRYWEISASYAHAYERWQEAIDCYEAMPSIEMATEEQYNMINSTNFATMLVEVGRTKEAIDLLKKTIKSIAEAGDFPTYRYHNALACWIMGRAYEAEHQWESALSYYLESRKISESSEAIVGSARCMKALNSTLLKMTLEKGLESLSQEVPTAYLDYTPEWLFMIEMLGDRAKVEASKWVDGMIKIIPLDFWETAGRAKLLSLLAT